MVRFWPTLPCITLVQPQWRFSSMNCLFKVLPPHLDWVQVRTLTKPLQNYNFTFFFFFEQFRCRITLMIWIGSFMYASVFQIVHHFSMRYTQNKINQDGGKHFFTTLYFKFLNTHLFFILLNKKLRSGLFLEKPISKVIYNWDGMRLSIDDRSL